MSKADDKQLGSLHGALAVTLADAIKEGEYVFTKDGELVLGPDGQPIKRPAPPALLSVARQFLKDNRIESTTGNKNVSALEQAMDDMKAMPFEGEVPAEFKQ